MGRFCGGSAGRLFWTSAGALASATDKIDFVKTV